MTPITKQYALQQGKDWFFIAIGSLLYVVGYTCFILPYHFMTGAVTGIAALIFYATGFPVQVTYLAINVVLLIIALRVLGFKYMFNTIYAVVLITLFMTVIQTSFVDPATGAMPQLVGDQRFMACIFGGALEGLGIGVVFLNNGSTGGTDIVASIINKYKDMSLGQSLLVVNVLIISSCYFVFHDLQLLLFGFCELMVERQALDSTMNSVRQSVQFLIISKRYDDIAQQLSTTGRGVTLLDGEGWYTGTRTKIIMILCQRRESTRIFRIIRDIDPNAFVSQTKAAGVYGEGFDRMRG